MIFRDENGTAWYIQRTAANAAPPGPGWHSFGLSRNDQRVWMKPIAPNTVPAVNPAFLDEPTRPYRPARQGWARRLWRTIQRWGMR